MPSEGKTDMERIGVFSEMEYITIGDKYASPFARAFNEAASKNRQMLPGGRKEKSALQAGYFDPVYRRIYEGESYSNPVQLRRRYRMAESKKNLSKPFLPSNGEKMPCGVGTYYGTIGGPCPFFSTQRKDRIAYVPPGKNLYTSPGKKGTGYGYPNITIGKSYSHSVELYDIGRITFKNMSEEHHRLLKGGPFKLNLYPREYFDLNPYHDEGPVPPPKRGPTQVPIQTAFKPSSPGKKMYHIRSKEHFFALEEKGWLLSVSENLSGPGGMKAGTFDPYPAHSSDPYKVKMLKPITTNKQGRIFNSASTARSRPVRSIIAASVEKSLNVTNYKDPQVMLY